MQIPTMVDLLRLRGLGERYAHAVHALSDQSLAVQLPDAAAELSFEIAALLEWDFEAKQRFLEIRSATERVVRLLQALPALVLKAEERAAQRGRAKFNGHGAVS